MLAVLSTMPLNPPVATKSTTVGVPTDVYETFEKEAKNRGMKVREAAGRLLAWFNAQPPKVKTVMLGIQDGSETSYAEALAEMAKLLKERPGFRIAFVPDTQVETPTLGESPDSADRVASKTGRSRK